MPSNLQPAASAVSARIASTGSYLPPNIVRNEDLKGFPADALVLIERKTGVRERRHALPGQITSDLGAEAAIACLRRANIDPASVDAIVLATSSPDRVQPATAARVQERIGARRAFAFDINAVCSGFVYGLQVCSSLIESRACRRVLLVAAELYSRFLNPEDFATYPYFGDGAGAVLIDAEEPGAASSGRILRCCLHTDGSGADVIQIPAGGSMLPIGAMKNPNEAYFRMNGRQVYAFAVSKGAEVLTEICSAAGIVPADVKLIIPHQANVNIIRELANKVGVGEDRFFVNLDRVGNTAAASIPIALDEAVTSGRIKTGDVVAFVAFGGGLSWGASLVQF